MKNIKLILDNIEKNIQSKPEIEYFWIHSVRYQFLLDKINSIYSLGSNSKLSNDPEKKNNKKLKVLDIGCYPFHLGKALDKMGFDVWGISSEHEPIHGNPQIKVLNIETEKFPFPDDYFDLIIFTEVLEHLVKTPLIALREVNRVLKKDGHLVISTPNVSSLAKRLLLLVGRNIYYQVKDSYREQDGDKSLYYRHNREYTMGELEKLLVDSGFKINYKNFFISYTPFRKRKIPDGLLLKLGKNLNYLLMKIIPSLRDSLFIECSK